MSEQVVREGEERSEASANPGGAPASGGGQTAGHRATGVWPADEDCAAAHVVPVAERATAVAPPRASVSIPVKLLGAGALIGLLGDVLLRAGGAPGVNMSLWVASIAAAAFALHRWAGFELDRERRMWLFVAVALAAGLAWRDAPPLKLLALAGAALAFGLAAYRAGGAWVRRAGVLDYAGAFATGALYAWTAAGVVLVDGGRSTAGSGALGRPGWRRAAGVVRGLVLATPFLVLFGALFVSADAVFEELVLNMVRVDPELLMSHVALFAICGWLSTGYLRGLSTGTKLSLQVLPKRPVLGTTEVATVLAAVDLLFLVFVVVQFRYLFGGDALVQLTPDLTYAEYARSGFFELVAAVALVVPLLLVADSVVARGSRRDHHVFRALAVAQIGLVLAVADSAFQRLRLYHASYGLTGSRFYAGVLLFFISLVLIWLAATVLRGRRSAFAFGALLTAGATVAGLYVVNPDAIIARTNVSRIASADAPVAATTFDVAYATSLSADAAPVLIEALPALPANVQCPLARHLLKQWAPESRASLRGWSWSASRARHAVRVHEAGLRSMVGPGQECA